MKAAWILVRILRFMTEIDVQWRSQPDYLVPLCKFQIIIIIHCFRN